MFTFNKNYLFLTVILFLIEVFIALFVDDKLIRPFVGDVLVVILIYCCLRVFLNADYRKVALAVLSLAFTVEILQYFDYVKLLGVENNRVLSVALGRTFEWLDFAAYACGFALVIMFEFYYERHQTD